MLTVDAEGRSIVLIGSFNPAIFHPEWFAAYEVIGKDEARDATIVVITPDISVFSTDWFQLEVQKNRFMISARHPAQSVRLKDLAVTTFKILVHTPIVQLGINRDVHYRVNDAETWKKIGDLLVPKARWQKLGEPRTLKVVIQGSRPSCDAKYINVTVEASRRFPGEQVLAIISNEHYDYPDEKSATKLIDILEKNWESALEFSEDMGKSIWDSVQESEND